MGEKFLIDTNALIDFQTGSMPEKGQAYIAKVIDENFTISFINYIEFLGYADVSEVMKVFISLATVIEMDKSIIDQTILLRKKYRIKLPDAIIAATAITLNLTLVSNNVKDFEKIPNFKVLNPHKL
jgi:predicted nucleic acid-binding protein